MNPNRVLPEMLIDSSKLLCGAGETSPPLVGDGKHFAASCSPARERDQRGFTPLTIRPSVAQRYASLYFKPHAGCPLISLRFQVTSDQASGAQPALKEDSFQLHKARK